MTMMTTHTYSVDKNLIFKWWNFFGIDAYSVKDLLLSTCTFRELPYTSWLFFHLNVDHTNLSGEMIDL